MKRSGYIKRHTPMKRSNTPMKRTAIARVSTVQAKVNTEYHGKARPAFLSLPENRLCAFSLALEGLEVPATRVHHYRGRSHKLTNDQRFFVPACEKYDLWPHQNTVHARLIGLLCAPGEWMRSPKSGETIALPRRYAMEGGEVRCWHRFANATNIDKEIAKLNGHQDA